MVPTNYLSFINTLTSRIGIDVTEARIDESVRRILGIKFRMGLFERPFADTDTVSHIYSNSHRALARQAVRESLVLLKNTDDFLPLNPEDSICISGSGANSITNQSGGWTLGWHGPGVIQPYGETILSGLSAFLADKAGSVVSSECRVGIRVVSEDDPTYAEYVGDRSDPGHDNSGSCTATHGCVVVILAGRPVNIEALLSDGNTHAVVMAWFPGSEGGGIIDVLYAVNGAAFSGTLPMTWKRDSIDTPWNFCRTTAVDRDLTGVSDECEDIGGHYSNASSAPPEVLFPYGYGLQYH
jgi:beta-glucosidase